MKGTTVHLQTRLTVADSAAAFQSVAKKVRTPMSRLGEIGANVNGRDIDFGFFKPMADPVFGSLDNDPPSLSVGFSYGAGITGQFGNSRVLQMYVWDRGNRREVTFFAPHSIAGGAQAGRAVNKAVRVFAEIDNSIHVTE